MKKIEIRKECVRLRKFSPRNFTPANTTNEEQFSRKAGVETEISSLTRQLTLLITNSTNNHNETTKSIEKINESCSNTEEAYTKLDLKVKKS